MIFLFKYIALRWGGKESLMSNNEKFNVLPNRAHSREIYNVLMTFAKPSIQQTDNVGEKRQVIIGELLPFLDKTQGNQQIV